MEPDEVDVCAIDFMPTATEDTRNIMTSLTYLTLRHRCPDYHPHTLNTILLLNSIPRLPRPARSYHMNTEEREDWEKW